MQRNGGVGAAAPLSAFRERWPAGWPAGQAGRRGSESRVSTLLAELDFNWILLLLLNKEAFLSSASYRI